MVMFAQDLSTGSSTFGVRPALGETEGRAALQTPHSKWRRD